MELSHNGQCSGNGGNIQGPQTECTLQAATNEYAGDGKQRLTNIVSVVPAKDAIMGTASAN